MTRNRTSVMMVTLAIISISIRQQAWEDSDLTLLVLVSAQETARVLSMAWSSWHQMLMNGSPSRAPISKEGGDQALGGL